MLVFLPGFMAPAGWYRALLAPVADQGLAQVRIPQVYRPGPAALGGRPSVVEEAERAAQLVRGLARDGHEVWLGGHSRGGQAAWRAAELVGPAGLVLVDPVDGSGRRTGAVTTARPARFGLVPLVVGAGIGGPCAPEAVNHERFAAAAPRRIHVVVPDCGHADILVGRARDLGRRLCGGGAAPDAARTAVTALLAAHLSGRLGPHARSARDPGPVLDDPAGWPSPVQWR